METSFFAQCTVVRGLRLNGLRNSYLSIFFKKLFIKIWQNSQESAWVEVLEFSRRVLEQESSVSKLQVNFQKTF